MYTNFLQETSNIGRIRYREVSSRRYCELRPKNHVQYREVSGIKRPLHKGFVRKFDRDLSVPEKSVGCRKVSAIKDVRNKEVSP